MFKGGFGMADFDGTSPEVVDLKETSSPLILWLSGFLASWLVLESFMSNEEFSFVFLGCSGGSSWSFLSLILLSKMIPSASLSSF